MITIQPADPVLRRGALVLVGLVMLGGVVLHATLGRLLEALGRTAGASVGDAAARMLVASVAVLSGLLLALGISMWRVGANTRASRTFPPPGTRVIRNTVVLHDVAATRHGVTLQLLAVMLLLCLVGLAVTTWHVVRAATS